MYSIHNKDNLNYCFLFAILSLLLLIVYSNSLQTSWHLDDYNNIVWNHGLRINNLMPESFQQAFFAHPSTPGKLYRPLPMLSLALNWYWGQDQVLGYHLVNLLIHILCAWILFLLILNLYKTPILKTYRNENIIFISLLATVLWALNPIQTQAVTYIVQRMASMATMFYLLGMLCYVKARLHDQRKAWLYFSGSFFCFLFALGSKENTITFPFALLMLEFIFFQTKINVKVFRKNILISLLLGSVLIAFGTLLFLKGDLSIILRTYDQRPFTLAQRLLTEPRIIIYYLSQIFYPIPGRLCIDHDILISTSILHPWTNLPAIIFIFFLISLGVYWIKKQPLLSFPILFYFLTHCVESTVIGLELFFEHRNYLPSLFLFWPIAFIIYKVLIFYQENNRCMFRFIITAVILLIMGLGLGTHIRNLAWTNEKTFWEDAVAKAPLSSRPLYNLAYLNTKINHHTLAMVFFKKALNLHVKSSKEHSSTFNNIALLYYRWNKNAKAGYYWDQAMIVNPKNPKPYYGKSVMLFNADKWEDALKLLQKAADNNVCLFDCTNLRGFILLKNSQPIQALPFFQELLKKQYNKQEIMTYLGIIFTRLGYLNQGYWFLQQSVSLKPDDNHILLYLAENRSLADKTEEVEQFINVLIDRVGTQKMKNFLIHQRDSKMIISANIELFKALLTVKLEERIIEMKKFLNEEKLSIKIKK